MGCGASRDVEADVYTEPARPQSSKRPSSSSKNSRKPSAQSTHSAPQSTGNALSVEPPPENSDGTETSESETSGSEEEEEDIPEPVSVSLIGQRITSPGITEQPVVAAVVVDEVAAAPPPVDETAEQVVLTGPKWRDLLVKVSTMELWGGVRRENRNQWMDHLERAEEIVRLPRKQLPEDIVRSVLLGDLTELDVANIPGTRSRIIIFISSTFTDTTAERNTLIRDVYPYLRTVSRSLGLDFGTVDMRWGVKEETSYEHGTLDMCLREVDRCNKESAGPAFLAIFGQKYGYRQFPPEIEKPEYEKMVQFLQDSGDDTAVFDRNFALDTNAVPAKYVLKPRSREKSEQESWWNDYSTLQVLLRKAADECLPAEKAQLYHISVTENEVKRGVFDNESRDSQAMVFDRTLAHLEEPLHRDRKMIDVVQSEEGITVDFEAQELLTKLKNVKVVDSVLDECLMRFDYDENDEEQCKEYVRRTCDAVCEKLVTSILQNYQEHLHVERDEAFYEILLHRAHALDKCSLFVGREDLLGKITGYTTTKAERPYVVHGQSGSGKTALMAMAAQKTKSSNHSGVLVYRFLGTTGQSGSARAVLRSVCMQISRAYEQDPTQVPIGYKELIPHFKQCMGYATDDKPLTIFLDSLDQLSNEDFGQNLKWLHLKEDLPSNVHIVVSTLPGSCLDVLKSFLPADNFLEVLPMKPEDGPGVLNMMLSGHERTINEDQQEIILTAFNKCPLPLYLRLAVDVAIRWHSYDVVTSDDLAADMKGLVSTLFERLESRYGLLLVHHALAYITAARNGLSSAELEDILSCDDEVLEEVFEYWLPPFRRIPQLLWIRIRNELGIYLVERGADGVSTYGWYHRQFWEVAKQRYLNKSPKTDASFDVKARTAIVDYFEGRYYDGKMYEPKKISSKIAKDIVAQIEDRQVPRQPIVLAGDRKVGRKLNRRKLTELPYNLIRMADWSRFEATVASLEFVEAKFEAEMGYDCMNELIEASKNTDSALIQAMSKFIGAGLSHLVRESFALYQLASQQVEGNLVRQRFDAFSTESLPVTILKDLKPVDVEDPCEMTLQGHTSGVRCCQYSPNGEMIASTAEDGSLRLWDAYSGAEVVTVTGLPGPTYPNLADPYHGERPCTFSRDGGQVATGSEDGWLQVWDLTGAQVHSAQSHSDIITGVAYSPDGTHMSTSAKDGSLKVYSSSTFEEVAKVSFSGAAMGCAYSQDGSFIAVPLYRAGDGLAIVDTATNTVRSSGSGTTGLNICVACAPSGEEVATAGDNSAVTLWDSRCSVTGKLSGHQGWIWSVRYTADGSKLLSCSSDRTLKMWNMSTHSCLISLGGHQHRLTWVDFKPGSGSKFVTASLDSSLKVWDFEAVSSGMVPPVGGLHYICLSVSPDQTSIACSQGWSSSCELISVESGQSMGSAATHGGFIEQTVWSPDSTKFISVDTGHRGAYEAGAAKNAEVKVTTIGSGGSSVLSGTDGPCCLGCSNKYIAVGTVDTRIQLFELDSQTHIFSWSWLSEGAGVGSVDDPSVRDIACSLTEQHVAAAAGYVTKIYDVSDLSQGSTLPVLRELTGHSSHLKLLKYSRDGRHLASADIGGEVRIWDTTQDYRLLTTLRGGYVSMVKDMEFSPGSAYLVTVATEMSMRVWDVANGYQLKAVFFSPINYFGFVSENKVVVGEATGNKKYLEWPQ